MTIPDNQELGGGKAIEKPKNDKENNSNEANQSIARWTRAIACLTFALVFVGIVSAAISGCQWNAIKNSGDDSRKFGIVGARAYLTAGVSKTGFDFTRNSNIVSIPMDWNNGGNTSAVNLKIKGTCDSNDAKIGTWNSTGYPTLETFIGPKGRDSFYGCDIDKQTAEAMLTRPAAFIYYWGEATYKDIMSEDLHISRFCFVLSDFRGRVSPDKLSANVRTCYKYNCTDYDCK